MSYSLYAAIAVAASITAGCNNVRKAEVSLESSEMVGLTPPPISTFERWYEAGHGLVRLSGNEVKMLLSDSTMTATKLCLHNEQFDRDRSWTMDGYGCGVAGTSHSKGKFSIGDGSYCTSSDIRGGPALPPYCYLLLRDDKGKLHRMIYGPGVIPTEASYEDITITRNRPILASKAIDRSQPGSKRGKGPWIVEDDYPDEARKQRMTGVVIVNMRVGPDGRAQACTIRKSSGHSLLDRKTCDLLVRRGRWNPGKNAEGNPAGFNYPYQYNWGA